MFITGLLRWVEVLSELTVLRSVRDRRVAGSNIASSTGRELHVGGDPVGHYVECLGK
jgi:hypothetical protein